MRAEAGAGAVGVAADAATQLGARVLRRRRCRPARSARTSVEVRRGDARNAGSELRYERLGGAARARVSAAPWRAQRSSNASISTRCRRLPPARAARSSLSRLAARACSARGGRRSRDRMKSASRSSSVRRPGAGPRRERQLVGVEHDDGRARRVLGERRGLLPSMRAEHVLPCDRGASARARAAGSVAAASRRSAPRDGHARRRGARARRLATCGSSSRSRRSRSPRAGSSCRARCRPQITLKRERRLEVDALEIPQVADAAAARASSESSAKPRP